MNKNRIWLISALVLFTGFASIGFFKPTGVIRSGFTVGRSAATTFKVMTRSTNLNQYFHHPVTVTPLEVHQDKIGDRFSVIHVEKGDSSLVEVETVEFVDMEQFAFQFTSEHTVTRSTYTLVRNERGTEVQVTQHIAPDTWWRRSLLPLMKGQIMEEQDRVNVQLARLIESSPESLIGDWLAIGSDGNEQLFTFKSDGTLDWRISMGGNALPLTGIHYVRESSVTPELLDLSGFTAGPLRGLTLFGILDMSRQDTLMFDAEAGLPDDESVRPREFSPSAVTYTRIR